MIAVRGNNFYPAALEGVLRKFPEVVEYRVEIDGSAALAELRIEVEPTADSASGLAAALPRRFATSFCSAPKSRWSRRAVCRALK